MAGIAALLSAGLAAASMQPELLSASYTTIIDQHVSDVMAIFMNDDMNWQWADRLLHQEVVYTREHGALSYQQHSMPWPLAPRDLLLRCKQNIDHRAAVLLSECTSVSHDAAPSPPGFVRFQLWRTLWRIESLPNDRTKLHLEIEVPASSAYGVPRSIVRHFQKTSLRDSVTALLAAVRRLGLAPDDRFTHWKRSRSEATAAALRAHVATRQPSLIDSPIAMLRFVSQICGGGSIHYVLGLGLLLAAMHVLSFGVLAQVQRRLTSGTAPEKVDAAVTVVRASPPTEHLAREEKRSRANEE